MIDLGEPELELKWNNVCESVMDFTSAIRSWESLYANPAGAAGWKSSLVAKTICSHLQQAAVPSAGSSSSGLCVKPLNSCSTMMLLEVGPGLVSWTCTIQKIFTLFVMSSMCATSVFANTPVSSTALVLSILALLYYLVSWDRMRGLLLKYMFHH